MIKAVILDLDDTLTMTEALAFEMENLALVSLGYPPKIRENHKRTWGKPASEAIVVHYPDIDVEAFLKAHHFFIAQYVQEGKLDDIPQANYEALDQLIKLRKSVMVLTSRSHSELKHLLAPDHLLASRVKTFYYRDNMQFHKPDPKAFNVLLKDTQLTPGQCVYVGDSISDAIAAKEAGLHFIASLESGLRTEQDFDGVPVDQFIHSFPEVVEAVGDIDQ